LESPGHHLVEQLEKGDEVALTGSIGTDQDVQTTQIKVHCLNGFEASKHYSSQNSHVSVS
jgi:preprotein translocase subunit YajC